MFPSSRTGARSSGAEAPRLLRSLVMSLLGGRGPHSRAGPGIPFRHGGRQKPGSSRSGSSPLGSCRPGCLSLVSSRLGSCRPARAVRVRPLPVRPHGPMVLAAAGASADVSLGEPALAAAVGLREDAGVHSGAGSDRSRRRQSLRYIFHRRFRSLRPQSGSVCRQLTCLRAGIGSGLRFGFPIAFCSSFSTASLFWYDGADTTSPPAEFLILPRVNRILAKTIIHLSFFHSFLALLGLFFAVLDFWPLLVRLGSLYVSLSYFGFSGRFPQPVPYIYERKKSLSHLRYEKARIPGE